MLFLDANALYYYFGNEKLGQPLPPNIDIIKFRSLCDMESDIALPSSAFMEINTHFKDSYEALKSIIDFLADRNIKIWNNMPTYEFTKESTKNLQNFLQHLSLETHI